MLCDPNVLCRMSLGFALKFQPQSYCLQKYNSVVIRSQPMSIHLKHKTKSRVFVSGILCTSPLEESGPCSEDTFGGRQVVVTGLEQKTGFE